MYFNGRTKAPHTHSFESGRTSISVYNNPGGRAWEACGFLQQAGTDAEMSLPRKTRAASGQTKATVRGSHLRSRHVDPAMAPEASDPHIFPPLAKRCCQLPWSCLQPHKTHHHPS